MDVLFYIRSHRHYILVGDDIMAVFLLIIILCDVPIYVGFLFFLRSDVQYILAGNTVIAVLYS